jgi:iron complex transport system substrate-binding protein
MLPFRLLGLALVCLAGNASAGAPEHTVTLDNCGQALSFQQAPARAVTIGQAATEMLFALGLGDHLVGTSLWFNAVDPHYAEQNARVPRLANNEPGFETVIGKRPGLVIAQFEWMVGPQGVVGTREQFHDLGVPTYILPSDCEGKDNLVGADGTRLRPFRVESVYESVAQLAQIFGVPERGNTLIEAYRSRLAAATAQAPSNQAKGLSALVWFSSANLASDPYVAGRQGVADFLLASLGLRNVVTSTEEWPTVGWETLARANPSVIVIARMDRRRFPGDDYQEKLRFLRNDPVTRNMDAVKHDRIVILDAEALHAGNRLFTGIEELARATKALTP